MEEVAEWHNGPGTAQGFSLPTTRQHALDDLDTFLEERLPLYGRYQDAMLTGHSNLWHSLIAPALNIGLLLPQEVIDGALEKYETGRAPLNSVEGFIRQVLGWREYIRGMYWETMPGLRDANRFKAELPLPAFFWTGETSGLHCLDESIKPVLERGYAHHIQRLMVIGNYCLHRDQPARSFRMVLECVCGRADWVQLLNVHGMALAADTTFTTKPYAASASYIHKMFDYCSNCQFNHKERSGPGASIQFSPWTLCFVTGKRSPKTRDSACSIGPPISGARNNAKRFRGLRLPIAVPSRGHGKLWRTIPVSPRGAVEPTQTGKDIA